MGCWVKMKNESPKKIYHTLEDYDGGVSNGYYDYFTDTIHLLRGKDLEFRTELHERIHAARRDKITFRLGTVFQIQPVMYIFILAIGIITILSLVAAIALALIFLSLFACNLYEEYVANKAVIKSVKNLKKMDGGEIVG